MLRDKIKYENLIGLYDSMFGVIKGSIRMDYSMNVCFEI